MAHSAQQASVTDLTPDLAEKLRSVEREFERIQQSSQVRQRWFLLGLIPRIVQGIAICGVVLAVVSAFLFFYRPTSPTDAADSATLWLFATRFLASLAGSAITILIATWAHRYCEAKADGKL